VRGNCFLRGTSSDLAKLQPGVVGTFVTTLMHAVRLVDHLNISLLYSARAFALSAFNVAAQALLLT
jgi:hypothetical protein